MPNEIEECVRGGGRVAREGLGFLQEEGQLGVHKKSKSSTSRSSDITHLVPDGPFHAPRLPWVEVELCKRERREHAGLARAVCCSITKIKFSGGLTYQ